MRNEVKNFKMKTDSISDNKGIVSQQTLTIQKHDVKEVFLMLSNNRKDWRTKTVYAPGYFNKKTNFRVGNENSLYILDENANQIKGDDNKINNLLSSYNNYYIVYPIPAFNIKANKTFILEYNNIKTRIILDNHLGKVIGKLLANDNTDIDDLYKTKDYQTFLNIFIQKYNKNESIFIKLNKNIIINSNYEFVLGILSGYFNEIPEKSFIINKKLNLYSFSTMLNYLGASYSIRNTKDDNKNVWIQLPSIFKGYLPDKFIKRDQYLLYRNSKNNDNLIIKNGKNLLSFNKEDTLEEMVGNGKYLLIPLKEFIFTPVGSSSEMYDMTCEKADSTNFIPGFSPVMKNSDGDILGIQGIFTKEALNDVKKLSPETKEYYRSLNDGEIQNWVADDAILGLYEVTKDLK